MVSKSWKELDAGTRAKYEEMARKDKIRFEQEKKSYKGPWKVPQIQHKDRPKKPMSAFLAFGNERRKAIAEANPLMTNGEISSQLAKLWRECPPQIKQAYRDREARERETFKRYRAEWELMKQREVGIDTEEGRIPGRAVPSQISLEDNALMEFASKSGSSNSSTEEGFDELDLDDWITTEEDEKPKSTDQTADSGMSTNVTKESETKALSLHRHPFNPPSTLGASLFSLLHIPNRASTGTTIGEYTIEALLQDEALFEDFSPMDSPYTAPFVNTQLLPYPDSPRQRFRTG